MLFSYWGFSRICVEWNNQVKLHSTPFVFLVDTFTGEFLCGRNPSYNHLLKSLRVAIATNHINLNFPHKDVSLRKRWYLSIPQIVLIIFGLDIVSSTFKKNGNRQAECEMCFFIPSLWHKFLHSWRWGDGIKKDTTITPSLGSLKSKE